MSRRASRRAPERIAAALADMSDTRGGSLDDTIEYVMQRASTRAPASMTYSISRLGNVSFQGASADQVARYIAKLDRHFFG